MEYKDGFEVILSLTLITSSMLLKIIAFQQTSNGDMVRIIDIGGTLTYNRSLVMRQQLVKEFRNLPRTQD